MVKKFLFYSIGFYLKMIFSYIYNYKNLFKIKLFVKYR